MMKLAIFDFDSTLMDGETIDFLAQELNIKDKVAQITEEAMSGRLDFFESLTTRVALLKGLSYDKAVEICATLPAMPGAQQTIAELKKMGYTVVCFSGGFRIGTQPFALKYGIDADFSNTLHHKNGVLSGLVGGEMMFGFSKGEMLQRLQNMMKITPNETLVVGDGANDVSMFAHAKHKVAFCAHEILKKEANIIINEKDLTQIIEQIKG
jgi:phosphoserine phosphatase